MNTNSSGTDLPLLFPNSDHERLAIGAVYCALSAAAVPVYIVVLYVMTTDKELQSNPQYRLMNQINFTDFGQLGGHFMTGIFVIFPEIQVKCDVLVRTVGITTNALWLAMFPVMSVLSVSRVLIIQGFMQPTEAPRLLKALMVVGWLYSIGVWLWGCLTQNLTLNGVGWGYDLTKPGASTLADLEIYVCFPSLGITYIAYLVIVVHVQMKKRNISSTTSDGKRELKIFLQATFLCTYMITLITMWHNAESWFNMSDATVAILNSAWIFFSYINPVLLLTLNPTIRKKVTKLLKFEKNDVFRRSTASRTMKSTSRVN